MLRKDNWIAVKVKSLDNFIESIYREVCEYFRKDAEYEKLYSNFSDNRIRMILSTLHSHFITLFKCMNTRMPSNELSTGYFLAGNSQELMKAIEFVQELQESGYSLKIDDYYQEVINKCGNFLSDHGSYIPYMKKIELYYKIPIFIRQNNIIEKEEMNLHVSYNLELIGEGSYAHVYKYHDNFYQKNFALKRARLDSNQKEKKRFKREFEEMAKLSSPYVVEVYRYNAEKGEYVMEYMDYSLHKYIQDHNATLEKSQRRNIGNQILKAIAYLHNKKLFHRDISPRNVLIKKYEDSIVVKVSDFGLVKVLSSDLTAEQTEFKGSFNDPGLVSDGFLNYGLPHEIYALTRLLYYVMTGKEKLDKINDSKIKAFIAKGTNANKSDRFGSLDELSSDFNAL